MKYLIIFTILSVAGATSFVSQETRDKSFYENVPVEFIDFEDSPIYILAKN